MSIRISILILIACLAGTGCNRNMEPYVPGETPKEPDLSKIFPVGAEEPAPAPLAAAGPPGAGASAAAGAGQPIEGTIVVAPELADRIPAGATLFVIVRRGTGGPPTAVKRIEAPSFPLAFSIGPENRMIQTQPFVGPLQLTARLDTDGDAGTRRPGDLSGRFADPVDPGAKALTLTLDEII